MVIMVVCKCSEPIVTEVKSSRFISQIDLILTAVSRSLSSRAFKSIHCVLCVSLSLSYLSLDDECS